MSRVSLLFAWTRPDASDVEVSYAVTRDGVEIRTARDATGGFVELTDQEREAPVLDIEAERALSNVAAE